MADTGRNEPVRAGNTRESEQDAVQSSNDQDQKAEQGRESIEHEDTGDVDPDSAASDVDRDDTIDEP